MTAEPVGKPEPEQQSDALLRLLIDQVAGIASQLERLENELRNVTPAPPVQQSAFRFGPGSGDAQQNVSACLHRATRPPLPDPRLLRQIVQHRQRRARYFDVELFSDPAWDILLDLTAARLEHKRVSVTSACIASGVPPTTALRWIAQMTEAGLLERIDDEIDHRRAFVTITDKAANAIARLFADAGLDAVRMG